MDFKEQFIKRRGDYEALVSSFKRKELDEKVLEILNVSLIRIQKIKTAVKFDTDSLQDVDWMLATRLLDNCIDDLIETMAERKELSIEELMFNLFNV